MQEFMQMKHLMLRKTKETMNIGSLINHFWMNLNNHDIHFNIFNAYWTDHYATFLSILEKSAKFKIEMYFYI